MSVIGRPVTDEQLGVLARICHRSHRCREDVHCEQAAGFGLSFTGDSVRAVYLFDQVVPAELDVVTFPGALPGGVNWDDTLADIPDRLGERTVSRAPSGTASRTR